VVESSALLKRRSPKGYRGFESLPHRHGIADFRSSSSSLLLLDSLFVIVLVTLKIS
jgi:hypothetical protein